MPKSLWNSPSAETDSARDRIFVAPEKLASEHRWSRRRSAIAMAAGVVAIVALILIASNLSKSAPHDGGWVDHLKTFFGIEVPKKMDPAKVGVQVWTVQRNGYFYCSDDPNFKTLLPGAIMTQGDAVQSGYQPRVDYCQ